MSLFSLLDNQSLTMRGYPVLYEKDLYRHELVFRWRDVTHVVDHILLQKTKLPADLLLLEIGRELRRKYDERANAVSGQIREKEEVRCIRFHK